MMSYQDFYNKMRLTRKCLRLSLKRMKGFVKDYTMAKELIEHLKAADLLAFEIVEDVKSRQE